MKDKRVVYECSIKLLLRVIRGGSWRYSIEAGWADYNGVVQWQNLTSMSTLRLVNRVLINNALDPIDPSVDED